MAPDLLSNVLLFWGDVSHAYMHGDKVELLLIGVVGYIVIAQVQLPIAGQATCARPSRIPGRVLDSHPISEFALGIC